MTDPFVVLTHFDDENLSTQELTWKIMNALQGFRPRLQFFFSNVKSQGPSIQRIVFHCRAAFSSLLRDKQWHMCSTLTTGFMVRRNVFVNLDTIKP